MAKSAKTVSRSGEMNVYTVLLLVSAIVLAAGVAILASANMSQAEAGGNPGSPLNIVR